MDKPIIILNKSVAKIIELMISPSNLADPEVNKAPTIMTNPDNSPVADPAKDPVICIAPILVELFTKGTPMKRMAIKVVSTKAVGKR